MPRAGIRERLARDIHQDFIHDLPQPTPERGVAAELAELAEQLQHGVVQDLLGLVGVAEQAASVGRSPECAIDGFQCAQVAAPHAACGVRKLIWKLVALTEGLDAVPRKMVATISDDAPIGRAMVVRLSAGSADTVRTRERTLQVP
jgi:hypothetical protein